MSIFLKQNDTLDLQKTIFLKENDTLDAPLPNPPWSGIVFGRLNVNIPQAKRYFNDSLDVQMSIFLKENNTLDLQKHSPK